MLNFSFLDNKSKNNPNIQKKNHQKYHHGPITYLLRYHNNCVNIREFRGLPVLKVVSSKEKQFTVKSIHFSLWS